MADLIDRDALMEKICADCPQNDCVPDATDTVYGCMLADTIQDAPAVNCWISVKKRLPEKRKFVLCFCRSGIIEILYWNGYEWRSSGTNRHLSEFVTHWMPLPESPEPPEMDATDTNVGGKGGADNG